MRSRLTTFTLCAVLALACSEAPPDDAANESGQAPSVTDSPAPDTGPAGEVAPDSRAPGEVPEAPETVANVPEGVPAEFHVYFKTVPFTWGADAGLAKAKAAGKPAMLFYTADG